MHQIMKTDIRHRLWTFALGVTLSACALTWAATDTSDSGLGGTGRSTEETVAPSAVIDAEAVIAPVV